MTIAEYAQNLSENLTHFAAILQILAIGGGVGLFIMSIFEFKRYGEQRTMMSHHLTIARPLAVMLAAVLLLTLPFTLQVMMQAFWNSSSVMAYVPEGSSGWDLLMPAILKAVRIVGVFSFVRGVFLISRCGHHGGQPGQLAKSMVHLLGGVMCINIVATKQLFSFLIP